MGDALQRCLCLLAVTTVALLILGSRGLPTFVDHSVIVVGQSIREYTVDLNRLVPAFKAGLADGYPEAGHSSVFRVVSSAAAHGIAARALAIRRPLAHSQNKSGRPLYVHARSRELAGLAASPLIAERVQAVLGADIVLVETQLLLRRKGENHRLHADRARPTFCDVNGSVAVWLALRGVSIAATLEVLPYSHQLGFPPSDIPSFKSAASGWAENVSLHHVLGPIAEEFASRKLGRSTRILRVNASDGQAVLFNLALWHGSANDNDSERVAVAFRFMHADCPYAMMNEVRTPVILVSGSVTVARLAMHNLVSWDKVPLDGQSPLPVLL